jgi:endonuclease YncB( thermonuclease family)
MLQFKQHQFETEEQPRWNIGIDRRHVAAYVGLALVAGFAAGFIVSRYVTRKETTTQSQLAETRVPPRQATEEKPISQFQRVSRIVRADVIEVEGTGAVRLLGIETPDGKSPKEIYGVHGQRAVSFIEKLVLGQDVRLEFDSAGSNKDEAGQTLAYVYTRDGTMVNGEMVKQGFAFVRGAEQFSRANDFRGYERDAMQAMRGVWGSSSSSTLASTPPITPSPSTSPVPGDEKKKLSPLAPSAYGVNIPALSGSPTTPLEPGVWVSPADKMYHKSACDFLDKKKRSIPLSQAKGEGFTACSRCYASTVLKAP